MSFALDVIVPAINTSTGLLKNHLADFTDAELLVRPCRAANHALWQVGHVTAVEAHFAGIMSGTPTPLPEGFSARFKKEAAALDDAGAFSSKDELLSTFDRVRARTIEVISAIPDSDLTKANPNFPPFAPTVGQMAVLFGSHTLMHLGQIQGIRRNLGKPVLF